MNFASQGDFRAFAADLTGALGFQASQTAEPMKSSLTSGLDIGVTRHYVKFDTEFYDQTSDLGRSVAWDDTTYDDGYSLEIRKGLPYQFALGVTAKQFNDFTLYGANLSYSMVKENIDWPSIALVGFFDESQNHKVLDYEDRGWEFLVSKQYANLTPFWSLGQVISSLESKKDNLSNVPLKKATADLTKATLGLRVNYIDWDLFLSLNQFAKLEATKTTIPLPEFAEPTFSFNLKLGYRF